MQIGDLGREEQGGAWRPGVPEVLAEDVVSCRATLQTPVATSEGSLGVGDPPHPLLDLSYPSNTSSC